MKTNPNPTIKEIIDTLNGLVKDMSGMKINDKSDLHKGVAERVKGYLKSLDLVCSTWTVQELDYETAKCKLEDIFKYNTVDFQEDKRTKWKSKGTIGSIEFRPAHDIFDLSKTLSEYYRLININAITKRIGFEVRRKDEAYKEIKEADALIMELEADLEKVKNEK